MSATRHSLQDSSRYESLRARIARRYPARRERVVVGQIQLDFLRVLDPSDLVEESEAGRECDWQPYWAEAWESGEVLARWLEGRDLSGRRVLDLGCGMGMVGTIAAARGATVLFADAAPPALLFARLNSWPWRERTHFRRLDWRADVVPGPLFHLILGADILYDPGDWTYLERFWRRHLAADGSVVLGEPGRRATAAFPEWLRARSWQVTSTDPPAGDAESRVRILEASPVTVHERPTPS